MTTENNKTTDKEQLKTSIQYHIKRAMSLIADNYKGKKKSKMLVALYKQLTKLASLRPITEEEIPAIQKVFSAEKNIPSSPKKPVIIDSMTESNGIGEQVAIDFTKEDAVDLFMDNGQVDPITEREMKELSEMDIPDSTLDGITTDSVDINKVPGYVKQQEIDSELEEAALKKEQRKKASNEKKLARPLDVNILSEGITSPLQRADIITVGDLAELSFSELMEIPRIGILKAWTIREYLTGLKVPMDESMVIPKKKAVKNPKKTGLPTVLQAAVKAIEEEKGFDVPFTEEEFLAKQEEQKQIDKTSFKDPLYTRIIHIDYAELPWRYQAVLIDNQVHTIRDITELDLEQLKGMKKMGAGGIEFISKLLYKRGLSFKVGSMPKHDAPKSDRLKPISL